MDANAADHVGKWLQEEGKRLKIANNLQFLSSAEQNYLDSDKSTLLHRFISDTKGKQPECTKP